MWVDADRVVSSYTGPVESAFSYSVHAYKCARTHVCICKCATQGADMYVLLCSWGTSCLCAHDVELKLEGFVHFRDFL